MQLLQVIDGEWRSFRQIMDRFNEVRNEAFSRSRMEGMRYHLKLLVDRGDVERRVVNPSDMSYRRAAR